MVDESMKKDRVIGMIQPSKPGEKTLKKVGCLGRISTFNEAEDNRYLITLSGTIRFEIEEELNTTTAYRQIIPDYSKYNSDLEHQNVDTIDRSKLLALVKRYLENRKILADWEIIKETPTEQLINYSGILVPFTSEEKQLLLESKTIITRSHVLEALYQSYIFDGRNKKLSLIHI